MSIEHDKKSGKSWKSLADLLKLFFEFYKDMPLPNHFFKEVETWKNIILNHNTSPSSITNTLKAFLMG